MNRTVVDIPVQDLQVNVDLHFPSRSLHHILQTPKFSIRQKVEFHDSAHLHKGFCISCGNITVSRNIHIIVERQNNACMKRLWKTNNFGRGNIIKQQVDKNKFYDRPRKMLNGKALALVKC